MATLKRDKQAEGLAGRRKVMDWMPIDTAPKDGSTVLLWCSGKLYYGHWTDEWVDDGESYEPACFVTYDLAGTFTDVHAQMPVSHWMPLPPPPTAAE